jgi:hypothetical protein
MIRTWSQWIQYMDTYHTGLVVVLRSWQGCHARPLSCRMKETRRNVALFQLGIQVDALLFHGQDVRLLERVQSSQAVPGTTATPVFRNGQDHGKGTSAVTNLALGGMGANASGETLHPVRGLVIVRGTDNRHVVDIVSGMHGLHGGLKSSVSRHDGRIKVES